MTCCHVLTDVGVYGRTSNGHADYAERYGTRCATGVMQRKRYNKGFTDDEDNDDDNDAGRGRSTLMRTRRNRPPAASDSDTEGSHKTLRPLTKSTSTSSTVLPSSSSTLQYEQKLEADSSDSESTADASNATSRSGLDSGSDTEVYSEGSGPVKSARTTRSTSGGKPVVTNGHVRNYDGAKYRTRNQGRRTVHYEEADSDVEYDGKDGRRTLERRRSEVGSRARLCHS